MEEEALRRWLWEAYCLGEDVWRIAQGVEQGQSIEVAYGLFLRRLGVSPTSEAVGSFPDPAVPGPNPAEQSENGQG